MEIRKTVDQRRQALAEFLDVHAAPLSRNGSVVETWRTRAGRRTGPYFRIAYREGGRQRTLYLGADQDLANEARSKLRQLQSGQAARRRFRKLRTMVRRRLSESRRAWNAELMKVGLSLKGSEVRGWRARAQNERGADRHVEVAPRSEGPCRD